MCLPHGRLRSRGLGLTGVRGAEKLRPASAPACPMRQLRQPGGMWRGCCSDGLPPVTKQELPAGAGPGQVAGNAC